MKVTTESGAVYEFTKDGMKFRRLKNKLPIDPEAEVPRVGLRQDGKWLKLFKPVEVSVGLSMTLLVEPLDPPQFEGAGLTVRSTSPVVGVEND
ncbi:hypothetical protein SEA_PAULODIABOLI_284 [Microbacterium phage PauloDiaboli]|nr:hypothetical protein SEA_PAULODIABOLI_284 [Microbacterium phage PauloDiaboli]QWY84091.1 hypothetical protein SEA_A3WALLY_284 [Microbacterium phage A3Wally]